MQIQLPTPERPYTLLQPSSPNAELAELERASVIQLYKETGAILFRGFNTTVGNFQDFSDHFCNRYVSNESPGREVVSDNGRVQTVNLGQRHFALHPEMAREPWQPEIAWFNCQQPAESGGETIICDGIAVAAAFSNELKAHLRRSSLAHTQPTDLGWCRNYLNNHDLNLQELLQNEHESPLHFSLIAGQLCRTYTRPMLHKPMFSEQWAYGNFLVFARRNVGDYRFPCFSDGALVPDSLVDEIVAITESLQSGIRWEKKDLLMLDNTRFMHGRNPIGGNPEIRRIITQFGYLSFAPLGYATPGC